MCEQSPTKDENYLTNRDEITDQSEINMKAYASLFNQTEAGVVSYG